MSLSAKIKAELEARFGAAYNTTFEQDFCDALAAAIKDYLATEVSVSPGISVSTAGGPGATDAPGILIAP